MEDLTWATVALMPLSRFRESIPPGILARIFIAAGCLWCAAVVFRQRREGRKYLVLLSGVVAPFLLVDASAKWLAAPTWLLSANAVLMVCVVLAVLVQERLSSRPLIPGLPPIARRALGWPMLMIQAELFDWAETGLLRRSIEAGEWGFGIILSCSLFPFLYGVFVVIPRLIYDPPATTRWSPWIGRYLWAFAFTLIGVGLELML